MITFEAASDRQRESWDECQPIDFEEILAATEIVADDDACPPWHDDDGWTHEFTPSAKLRNDHSGVSQSLSWVRACDYSKAGLITISDKTIREWVGRCRGASKQVYAERLAAVRCRAIKQLKDWYTNGWEVWGVRCEFRGEEASVWGVYCARDDEYLDEVREEIAGEVAHALKRKGTHVVNISKRSVPDRTLRRPDFQARVARNLGFEDRAAYREWVMSRPRTGGWPKKNETARIYREKNQKSYIIVFPKEDGRFIGRLTALVQPYADAASVCSSTADSGYIYGQWLKRTMWSELPRKWREAFRPRLDIPPCDIRGFWRVR